MPFGHLCNFIITEKYTVNSTWNNIYGTPLSFHQRKDTLVQRKNISRNNVRLEYTGHVFVNHSLEHSWPFSEEFSKLGVIRFLIGYIQQFGKSEVVPFSKSTVRPRMVGEYEQGRYPL